jgi:hypothetical protein
MEQKYSSGGGKPAIYRKSIRITFRVLDGSVDILSYQRLPMTCPPSVGLLPEEGKNSGYWLEVRDAKDKLVFHRILSDPLGDSVSHHLSGKKIERNLGTTSDHVFQVLIPDIPDADSMVLMGESLEPEGLRLLKKQKPEPSRELKRFAIPEGEQGGTK